MKIAILLPYKEDYTPKYSGAVSIHVSNLIKYSKYKDTKSKITFIQVKTIDVKWDINKIYSND